ncbi:MAG: hypothetical protein FWG14_04390 [Peptococcaceae bacterium]|nr:hypothetical protein [Peptococcaceae bacterium]
MNTARGQKLLSSSGVLLVVFGLITVAILVWALIKTGSDSEWGVVDVIGVVLWILSGGLAIVTGVLGIRNCKLPEKAQQCLIMGSGLIVSMLALSSLALVFAREDLGALEDTVGFAVFSLVALIVPVLYLIGAIQNKKSLDQG